MQQRSLQRVGLAAVLGGPSGHVEVERGICSVLVAGGRGGGVGEGWPGSLVCLWLGVWTGG